MCKFYNERTFKHWIDADKMLWNCSLTYNRYPPHSQLLHQRFFQVIIFNIIPRQTVYMCLQKHYGADCTYINSVSDMTIHVEVHREAEMHQAVSFYIFSSHLSVLQNKQGWIDFTLVITLLRSNPNKQIYYIGLLSITTCQHC